MKIAEKHHRLTANFAIAGIILTTIIVLATMIFSNLYEKRYFAQNKFEQLARLYYEENLYPKFISTHAGDPLDKMFEKYRSSGFTVQLRQILNSEILEKNQDYQKYFNNKKFSCDTNASNVIFRPIAPFGKKNYNPEFNLICNDK